MSQIYENPPDGCISETTQKLSETIQMNFETSDYFCNFVAICTDLQTFTRMF